MVFHRELIVRFWFRIQLSFQVSCSTVQSIVETWFRHQFLSLPWWMILFHLETTEAQRMCKGTLWSILFSICKLATVLERVGRIRTMESKWFIITEYPISHSANLFPPRSYQVERSKQSEFIPNPSEPYVLSVSNKYSTLTIKYCEQNHKQLRS